MEGGRTLVSTSRSGGTYRLLCDFSNSLRNGDIADLFHKFLSGGIIHVVDNHGVRLVDLLAKVLGHWVAWEEIVSNNVMTGASTAIWYSPILPSPMKP